MTSPYYSHGKQKKMAEKIPAKCLSRHATSQCRQALYSSIFKPCHYAIPVMGHTTGKVLESGTSSYLPHL